MEEDGSHEAQADKRTSRRFRIKQRGTIAERHFADLVVFDPETIGSEASFEHPRQDPSGIEYVLVNGRTVIRRNDIQPGLHGRIV